MFVVCTRACVCVSFFLATGNLTYNEVSYLTISSIQNKAKNLLKSNEGDRLEAQIEVIKAHFLHLLHLNTERKKS